ncbi:MAG: NMD3-related protein [Nanoarchaeota archaeon]
MDFCAKCGTSIDCGALCAGCSTVKADTKKLSMSLCDCGRYWNGTRWLPYTDLHAIARSAAKKAGAVAPSISSHDKEELHLHDASNNEYHLTIKSVECEICHRKKSGYFQGILQLRCDNQDILLSVLDFIGNRLKDSKAFIAKIEEHKAGIDLYVSDNHYFLGLTKKLQNHFGGTITQSPQIFTRDKMTSKDVYRVNTLIRLPSCSVGDAIVKDGNVYVIIKHGKRIVARDLGSGKQAMLDYRDTMTVLKKHITTASVVHPRLEAIHPATFQSEPILNTHRKSYVQGQEITIVISSGMYIIE